MAKENEFLTDLGGAANVLEIEPCITRLRVEVADPALVDDAALKRLEYLYWYTLEFGLVEEDGKRKAVGAGLLSSFGELGDFEKHAEIRPLDCDAAAAIPYDPTRYQELLFVSPSFDRMVEDVSAWLERQ